MIDQDQELTNRSLGAAGQEMVAIERDGKVDHKYQCEWGIKDRKGQRMTPFDCLSICDGEF